MRVALINPPQPYLVEPGRTRPLGLMYLHSAVRAACKGVWIDLCDLSDYDVDNVVPHLVAGEYDVFAWTATSLDYPLVEQLAQRIAGKVRSVHVLGGPHATAVDRHHHIFRAVFKGEAERTFPRFLEDLQRGEYNSVYGGERIDQLDLLHFPYRGGSPQGRIMAGGADKSATIIGSRGCAHKCAFCASDSLWPGMVRFREPKAIAREVALLRDKGGITDFAFFDENLTASLPHLEKLCAALKPLRIHWRAQARVDTVDLRKLRLMRDAGCREVDFGIESFDNYVLNVMCKRTTAELNIRAVELAHEVGIPARLFMMISTPGEVYKKTVQWNIEHLQRLQGKYAVVNLYTFMPLPGTPIWMDPDKYGVRMTSNDWGRYNRHQYRREHGVVVNKPWSPIEIVGMTRDEQMENISTMHDFVNTLSETNRGVQE